MKKILINIILIFITSITQAQVKKIDLEKRDGIFYEIGKNIPFTGESYTFYPDDNKESFAEFLNGKLNGEMKNWYPNGKIQVSGKMLKGEKNGVWTAWLPNGYKIREGTYLNNKEEGLFTWWFENGNIKKKGTYKNGVTNGKWTWYFENGEKESEGKLLNDRNIGKWFWWNEKGELIHEKDFSNQEDGLTYKNLEQLLIGKWEYVRTTDKENNTIQHIIKKFPNGNEMKIVANGPNIIVNKDGTYEKKFDEDHTDYGNWKFLSEKEIEYELITPIHSRGGKLITQAQNAFNKRWEKDGNGNYLEKNKDIIIALTKSEMKIEYQKDYILIYKKKPE